MAKETEKPKHRFVVGQVATQLGPSVYDTEENKHLDIFEALVQIANDVREIKKGLD